MSVAPPAPKSLSALAARPLGRVNIAVGLWYMAGFMVYGFVLIYLRDFAPDKEAWIAESLDGDHFEARLAHVHGNLFALLNITFGFLMSKLPVRADLGAWASRLILAAVVPTIMSVSVEFLKFPVPALIPPWFLSVY